MRSQGCSVGLSLMVLSGAPLLRGQALETPKEILFVCEHGNVKSLMAATYFNELARQRGLSVRALARGVAPDAPAAPPAIIEGLRQDGFDVSGFHPEKFTAKGLEAFSKVIFISLESMPVLAKPGGQVEVWTDVPPASTDFGASRRVLKDHVEALIKMLTQDARKP